MFADTLTLEQQLLSLMAGIFQANSVVLFVPLDATAPSGSSRLVAYESMDNKVIPDVSVAPGQGLVGWILKNRKPLAVPRFAEQPSNLYYYEPGDEQGITGFMGAPLPSGGCLCVDTKRSGDFSDEDHKRLAQFAQVLDGLWKVGSCDVHADEIPRYFTELAAIDALRFQHKPWSEFIRSFLESLARATVFDYAAFASVVKRDESYCIEAESHPLLVQNNEPFYQAWSKGLAGFVFRNGGPVAHSGEDNRAPALFGTSTNLPEFTAVVCLPVFVNKSVRGVVCMGHYSPHAVDKPMQSFFGQAVNMLSLHLENLSLRDRLRDLLPRAQVYRKGPRMHDPDTEPYCPPRTEREE